MADERYRHIFLTNPPQTVGYTSPRTGGPSFRIPGFRNREQHGTYLRRRLEEAWEIVDRRSQGVAGIQEREGIYLEFFGEPGFDLVFQSLERVASGIRLLNVRTEGRDDEQRTIATVYVPNIRRGYFLRKIRAYAEEIDRRNNKPKNARLVNSISEIRKATLASFWRLNEYEQLPHEDRFWVEVWLRGDQETLVVGFEHLLSALAVEFAKGYLKFPERAVVLIHANLAELERLIEESDNIAEFRIDKRISTFFIDQDNADQALIVQDFLSRCSFEDSQSVVVCLLDSGVNNGHPLLLPVLGSNDLLAVEPTWPSTDDPRQGHGTLMAGTASYGNLLAKLNMRSSLRILHRLESVRIIPPPPDTNPPELWGYRTIQASSLAEIHSPEKIRIYCLAISASDTRDRGHPSSWSAAIDQLSSGYDDGEKRLFVVAAGNVSDPSIWRNYPDGNLTDEIHDPAQAWNALTVGAYTELAAILDPDLHNYEPIAPSGGLSPFSTTSYTWSSNTWPAKPDIVFEGGNVAAGPNNSVLDHDDLQLLSTSHEIQIAHFAPFGQTSAAAALAAEMAASVQVEYPQAWPETIRALLVHSAEWTEQMKEQFLSSPNASKAEMSRLLRICGYGVPDIERALYCASNSLTLISEADIQPFDRHEIDRNRYVTRDMHLYNLPWPSEILLGLGETIVSMRITLSYFVEPGPGEVGWQDRYRYASHGLRFDLNGPGEAQQEFIRRINLQARDSDGPSDTSGPGTHWVIGSNGRNTGSIHSDIWIGTAADLAQSHYIAVYPTIGWWRTRHHLDRWDHRSRYSLIVSIRTPEQDQDIYIAVTQKIGIGVPIEITTSRG